MLAEDRARQYLDAMLEQYQKKALGVQRRYLVSLAMVENDQGLDISQRQALRRALVELRGDELQAVRIDAQKALSSVRLYVATLGDDLSQAVDPGLSVRGLSREEYQNVARIVERLKQVGGE